MDNVPEIEGYSKEKVVDEIAQMVKDSYLDAMPLNSQASLYPEDFQYIKITPRGLDFLRNDEEQLVHQQKIYMPEISDTQAQPENQEFDVFLAHNSADKPEVRTIANQLKERGIKVWLDEEQIPPGRSFQDEIQKAIPLVKSAAIFIGMKGLGKWQTMEVRSLTRMCVEKDIPLIPVVLPGVSQFPEKLVFLKEYTRVDFSKSIDDIQALKNLVWGITASQSSLQQNPTELWFNGERLQQFQKALLSAFPTTAKLKQMVRFRLDENLEAIAAGANLSEVASNLIEWAEAEGKLEKLLSAARKENPSNPTLRKFDEQMRDG